MIQALIGPIANLAGTWFQNKIEKTKADGQAKVAEAKARATVAEKVATGQVEWEGKMAEKRKQELIEYAGYGIAFIFILFFAGILSWLLAKWMGKI